MKLITSEGIKLREFYIPPFTIHRGEIVVIRLPEGAYFRELLFELVPILTGERIYPGVEPDKSFRYVRHIEESRWRSLLFPLLVKRYISRNANPHSEISKLAIDDRVTPDTKICSLAWTQRKKVSLFTELSWSDRIIFDLMGIDPAAAEEICTLIKRYTVPSGAAILIDYYDELSDVRTQLIEFQYQPDAG